MTSRYLRLRSAVLIAALSASTACQQQKVQSVAPPPPVPVAVARAQRESVPLEISVVGTGEASAVVQVKSQVSGELIRTGFTEGQNVAAGSLLLEVDSRPYRDALRQAEAAVLRDRALLRQAEASLSRDQAQARNADSEAARNQELAQAGLISKSQHDQVRTSAEVARESARASQAAIESARASIESDLAAVERAKLDISYCRITAPISGRSGNLLVQPGNLVKANDTALVVLHRITPLFVYFNVPERHLPLIRQRQAKGNLPVRATVQDNPGRVSRGRVTVVDNTVDATTGTIRLKAAFDNADGLLWPGQFVNVVLQLGEQQDATVVPAEAVQTGQQGPFVYFVKADQTVEPRMVVVGRNHERKVLIDKGLAPGDTVVTDGQMRLFPGAKIKPVDAAKIESEKL